MSNVPAGKRGINKLEVWQEAVKLARYTMTIVSNENTFPERYSAMNDRISNSAIAICEYLWKANNINVKEGCPRENIEERLHLQDMAIAEINTILFLIDLAGSILHRPEKKTIYWGGMAVRVKSLAVAWRESDKKRLT